jgi:hypothetical protein
MNLGLSKSLGLLTLACLLFSSLSCGREEELVSIDVLPVLGITFEGAGAAGQVTAIGHFIHPPSTKDITGKVTWKIDVANFATVTPTGFVSYTRSDGCGKGNVSATHSIHPDDTSISGRIILGSTSLTGVNDGTDVCKP